MRYLLRFMILLFICALPHAPFAQEQAKEKDKAPATSRVKKKAAKKKWKEQRKIEKEQKKAVKVHHKRIQTKQTRKSMRKEKRKSDKIRGNKREFFLIRWFKYRR